MPNLQVMTVLRGALAAAVLCAAGCAGDGPSIGLGGPVNYAAGSAMAGELGGREIDTLYPVFLDAMERGEEGAPKVWSAGSYSGSVTPGRYLVANLKTDVSVLLPLSPGLDLGERYETELGLHALTANANLRAAPTTDARVLASLTSGDPVDVIGKVVGKPWMLVAIDGVVRGYVHQNLMVKAPGSELLLAGGPTRRAFLCREFDQTLSLFGKTDHWSGVACDRGEGWRLEAPRASNTPLEM